VPPTRRLLRFGTFEADLDERELRKRGAHVRLPLQAFQVLQVLLENPGRVVTRDELRRALWSADTYVEFDRGLNNAISRVRDLLDDSAASPRFIETVPRRGYRFIAPVESVGPGADDSEPLPAPSVEPRPLIQPPPSVPPWRRWVVAAAIAAAAIAAAAMVYRNSTADVLVRSVAVLPLTYNASPDDARDEYLAEGMTEALIAELSKLGELRVISATSSGRYKDSRLSLPEIARELGVDAVIEGSVFREANVARVTVQLIRAATDDHLWAHTYTRGLGSMLALQSEVAIDIAREIGTRMTAQERMRMTNTRAVDPEAYRLYVLGQRLRQRETEPELYAALDHFQQALKLAPGYARAYWGIAEVWISLGSWAAYLPPREGMPKAKAAALQAIALDGSLAEAHSALAFVTEVFDWDLPAAEASYRGALALSPNDAVTHRRFSLFLNRTRRAELGVTHATRAFELDPLSIENNISLAQRLSSTGQRDAGVAAMLRATELDPTHFHPWVHLAETYLHMGRAADALVAAERALALSNQGGHAAHMLAQIHGRLGDRAKAEAVLRPFEQTDARINPYDLGMLHLGFGNHDKALQWLGTACEARAPQMAFFHAVHKNQNFDPIRADARFARIVECASTGLKPIS
jgi:TolB-like protein/DNA-binding winged helix-turn-helix (wHTH) protein/tetratricopeptide (TPR) repeat protein